MSATVLEDLAPGGVLRAGINVENDLLVSVKDGAGGIDGVAPQLVRRLAARLGTPYKLVLYSTPKELAAGAAAGAWDIGLIAAEPERATVMDFSQPYVEILAHYLVRRETGISSNGDIDAEGVRVSFPTGSAYGLWIERNLKQAQFAPQRTLEESQADFAARGLEVLAGLRSHLLPVQEAREDTIILDDPFMRVQQAIGVLPGRKAGLRFVNEFIDLSIREGLIAELVSSFGVDGGLTVAWRAGASAGAGGQ
jgi:polar amino acid transport system substrate-binding protein